MKIDWSSKNIDIGRYAGRTSGHVKVHCPECHDSRKNKADKSLSCDMATGYYRCHHCGWHGYATITTPEEKQEWMQQQPWYRDYSKRKAEPKRTYERPPKPRGNKIAPDVIAFFKKRSISEKTLETMRVTSGTDWMPANRRHRLPNGGNCTTIHFNYYSNGELIATKLRSGDKCFRQAKAGCEQIAYNIDNIRNTDDCYIVEGEMDALSLAEIGYTNVISVPDGGSDKQMHWLVDYYEELFADKKTIYICVDNDKVGTDLCNELVKHFEPGTYVIVTDFGTKPDGTPCKDANECLMHCGAEVLRKKLDGGRIVRPEGDADMERVAEEMDDLFENGLPKGMPFGFPNLDPILRAQKGRLYILTGTPGSGKSQFLDHMAMMMHVQYGWKFSVFSPEMMPLAQHLSMYVTKLVGKPFYKDYMSREEYNEARNVVINAVHFIEPEDNELDKILAIAKYQVRKYGCDGVIIDPWNSLLMDNDSVFKPETINRALLKILTFAQRQDIAAFVMPHPINQQTDKNGKPIKIHLYNISGGAQFRNRADFGIVMTRHYKDDADNSLGFDYVEMSVEKTKWETVAELGTVFFRYQKGVGRFHVFDPATGETQWDERNYLRPKEVQTALPVTTATAPKEGDVQGFLDQARRQEKAMRGNQNENDNENQNENENLNLNENQNENENEDIFDNNDNEELPY